VTKLKSRVEEPSRSSSEVDEDEQGHLKVIDEDGGNDTDEEAGGTDAPRISQWVDGDEDLYGHANDEPVRLSLHHNSYKYI
jgi:hypothetical protein